MKLFFLIPTIFTIIFISITSMLLFSSSNSFSSSVNAYQTSEQNFNMEPELTDAETAQVPIHLEKLKKHPNDPMVWSQLAYVLPHQGSGQTIEFQGKKYNKQQCYVKSLELEPTNGASWYNVGVAMGNTEKIIVNGKKYSKIDTYVEAATYAPKMTHVWYNLGQLLGENQQEEKKNAVVKIKGIKTTSSQCYANALQQDPSMKDAWNNLGTSLKPGEFISVDGVKYDRKRCFVEELENNPTSASAWHNLALSLSIEKKETARVNGVKINRRKALIKTLKYKPTSAQAWHNLAALVHPTEKIKVNKEKNLNSTLLYIKALNLNQNMAASWFGLGVLLNLETNETATIGKEEAVFTKRDCYLKTLELQPQWADPWNNLATVMKLNETITVNGEVMNPMDLIIKSIDLAPEIGRTWKNLCSLMTAEQTVIVDGGYYTRDQCDKHAQELEDAKNLKS